MERKDFIKEMDIILKILHNRGFDSYERYMSKFLNKIEDKNIDGGSEFKNLLSEFRSEIRNLGGSINSVINNHLKGLMKDDDMVVERNKYKKAIDAEHEDLKEDILYLFDDLFNEGIEERLREDMPFDDNMKNKLSGMLDKFESSLFLLIDEQRNAADDDDDSVPQSKSINRVSYDFTKQVTPGKLTKSFSGNPFEDSIGWTGDYMKIPYVELVDSEEKWLKIHQEEEGPFHIFVNKHKFDKHSFANRIKEKINLDKIIKTKREIRLIIYGFQKPNRINIPKIDLARTEGLRSDKLAFNRMAKAIRMAVFNDPPLALLRGNGQLTIISYFVPM